MPALTYSGRKRRPSRKMPLRSTRRFKYGKRPTRSGFLKRWFFLPIFIPLTLGTGLVYFCSVTGTNPLNLVFAVQRGTPVMELAVISEPAGATVLVEGQPEAQTTPTHVKLPAGTNQVEVRKNGFGSFRASFEITGSSPEQGSSFPVYTTTVTLQQARASTRLLPASFPGARLEYARYLNASLLELTEVAADRTPLPPGVEGLPTNLSIFNLTSNLSSPVVVSHPALETVAKAAGVTGPSEVALTAPALAPDARRLAFVARRLKNQSSTSQETKPAWNDESIFITPLAASPSSAGAILTNSEPLALFSLDRLTGLLPGLAPSTPSSGFSNGRFATIEQLYWSPSGDRLLAVVKVASSESSGSGSPLTVMVVVVGTGSGTPPGLTLLATPQPLPLQVLPGTLNWSQDGAAVTFLVTQSSGFGSQDATGLCLLDLRQASEKAEGQAGNRTTPLRYLGEVSAGRFWEQISAGFSNLTGERSYPLHYGQSRYNPFAWLSIEPGKAGTGEGVYGALAPAWARENGQSYDTLYPYPASDNPAPLLDLGKPLGSASRSSRGTESSDKTRQDTYPFITSGGKTLYLSGQVVTRDTGQFMSGASGLQLQVKELASSPGETIPVAKGLTLKILTGRHDPVMLPLFDNLTNPRFEVEWRPDGQGLLVAVPSTRSGQGAELWLADWKS